ncbi:hypothetical protein [Oryza sativa Japonica Group]|uniref:Uncharacterized protein n=1 Tax=Oryza sativa subsp. japonica TaxID=39947 RepID=Q5N7L7_ORYSJ|nr:hypothetical protein [Oryza sativa Japonica Group]
MAKHAAAVVSLRRGAKPLLTWMMDTSSAAPGTFAVHGDGMGQVAVGRELRVEKGLNYDLSSIDQ